MHPKFDGLLVAWTIFLISAQITQINKKNLLLSYELIKLPFFLHKNEFLSFRIEIKHEIYFSRFVLRVKLKLLIALLRGVQ